MDAMILFFDPATTRNIAEPIDNSTLILTMASLFKRFVSVTIDVK
jgi:hypothetical protein